jgi:prepilin-type N-terminal cleavage/methylation domain-containing protein
MSKKTIRKGFTLVELLIVVAIILILIAIALPNFTAALVRTKVARVRSDMRTVATALDAYFVDNRDYPTGFGLTVDPSDRWRFGLWLLSTPIAYVTAADIQDPLHRQQVEHATDSTIQYNSAYLDERTGRNGIVLSEFLRFTPQYMPTGAGVEPFGEGWRLQPHLKTTWFILFSNGPDQNHGFTPTNSDGSPSPEFDIIQRLIDSDQSPGGFLDVIYSPTNGIYSTGNIWRSGGIRMNAGGRLAANGS